MYRHHIQQTGHVLYQWHMDQPCKVANPARGQLNRENEYFPAVRVRAWEFGLARRVRWSSPASACLSPYSGRIWCLLTGFLPSSAAASIYLSFDRVGCQSCSWSAEHRKTFFPLSPFAPENFVFETGSTVPSRVRPLVLRIHAESDSPPFRTLKVPRTTTPVYNIAL